MEKLPYSIPARLRTYAVRISDPVTGSFSWRVDVGIRKDILSKYSALFPHRVITIFVESRNR